MKQRTDQMAFPVKLMVMVALLSTIFVANVSLTFAATGHKKSSAVTGISAVDYTEARITQLQGVLKITEPQEELWNNFTSVMRQNAKDMDALTKDRAENNKTMNAVDYMKFHSQITKAHLDQQDKLIPPFEALYVSMSNEQKKSTDILFKTGKQGKHKRT